MAAEGWESRYGYNLLKNIKGVSETTIFRIREDGTFAIIDSGEKGVKGTYKVDGKILVLSPEGTSGRLSQIYMVFDPKRETLNAGDNNFEMTLKKK